FSEQYLTALRERDEPASAMDGDMAGPWVVRERNGRFHLFREWEGFETGHAPTAVFAEREPALLFVSALRALSAFPLFRVAEESARSAAGIEVRRENEVVGHLRVFRPELLAAANHLSFASRSPADLASLLIFSGSQVQEMAGEILGQEILGDGGKEAGG
ncbi:MAG: hypothetical protein ACJ75H_13030, partial [Thermoanaerobaculia bacterium]